jgi:hypothetical protein
MLLYYYYYWQSLLLSSLVPRPRPKQNGTVVADGVHARLSITPMHHATATEPKGRGPIKAKANIVTNARCKHH